MTRVCLDCGTPKMPMREKCLVCRRETITHEGEAREKLCGRCRWAGEDLACQWTQHHPEADQRIRDKIQNHTAQAMINRLVVYHYRCPEFTPRYKDSGPSANPLSPQERQWTRLCHEVPKAFWLHGDRWDGVRDARREMFWVTPAGQPSITGGVVLGLGALASLAGLLISSKGSKTSELAGTKEATYPGGADPPPGGDPDAPGAPESIGR